MEIIRTKKARQFMETLPGKKNEQKLIGTCVLKQLSADVSTLRVVFVVYIHSVFRNFF
jgi:hypothetical protein